MKLEHSCMVRWLTSYDMQHAVEAQTQEGRIKADRFLACLLLRPMVCTYAEGQFSNGGPKQTFAQEPGLDPLAVWLLA
jgi:hypothetical protein